MIASQIQTPAERLQALVKPLLQDVTHCALRIDDCLVLCAGFEDRAVGILNSAIECGSRFNVLIVSYSPPVAENKLEVIRLACRTAGIDFDEITYDRHEPAGFGRVLVERVSRYRGRLVIDVSAMSRLLIVQVLVSLGIRPQGYANCFVGYSEALSYPPSQEEAKRELERSQSDPTACILFLSSGVFEITIVPELSTATVTGSQTRLITFPSLDAHHLMSLRAELQPSRCAFIEGIPPNPSNQWRTQVISEVNRLPDFNDAETCVASTLHYGETIDCLLNLYSRYSARERLLISPTGSKMQAVAVGLFRSIVQDVQIVYPTARGFNSPGDYTHGVGHLHMLPLEAFTLGQNTEM